MRQSDFKKRYDPELGRFTRQHIYGEGVMDVFKNFGSKILGQTLKKAAKQQQQKLLQQQLQKLVNMLEKKAEIIKLLSKSKRPKKVTFDESVSNVMKPGEEIIKILLKSSTPIITQKPKKTMQQDLNQRLNAILSND